MAELSVRSLGQEEAAADHFWNAKQSNRAADNLKAKHNKAKA